MINFITRYFSSLWNPSFASLRFVYLITCLFSGLFILFIKKFVLNNKRGEWYHGLFSVLTIENLFMILIFVADFRTTKSAFNIAEEIYFPILIKKVSKFFKYKNMNKLRELIKDKLVTLKADKHKIIPNVFGTAKIKGNSFIFF